MWLYYKQMFQIAKKIFFVLAVYVAIISVFTYNTAKTKIVSNQQALISTNRAQIYAFINNKDVQKTSQGRVGIAIFRSFQCFAFGEACTNNPADAQRNSQTSVMGYASKLVALPLQRPAASGVYWARNSLENSGFIPKSYAAEGIGVAGLKPIAQIWNLFRDLSYLIMVLVVTTIGFLIMFRRKINAQTVVSLENALPRIVIAFILITFSFAIAGFLIDLMYISIFVVISFLGTNTIAPFTSSTIKAVALNNGFSLWDMVMANGNYWKVGDAILTILPNQINIITRIVVSIPVILLLAKIPIVGDVYTGDIVDLPVVKFLIHAIAWLLTLPVLFFIIPTIVSVIFFLTALFIFFKIFFLLFKNYLTILLLIIFSPILLLLEAVPGQKAFSNWIKQLTAALLAFPVTIALILLSSIIVAIPSASGPAQQVNTPTAIGNGTTVVQHSQITMWAPPLLYSSYALPDAFSVLVGVGILFMIPNIIQGLKKSLGIKDGLMSGAGIGMFFGGVSSVAGGGMGSLSKYASLSYGLGSVGRIPGLKDTAVGKKLNQVFGGQPMPH